MNLRSHLSQKNLRAAKPLEELRTRNGQLLKILKPKKSMARRYFEKINKLSEVAEVEEREISEVTNSLSEEMEKRINQNVANFNENVFEVIELSDCSFHTDEFVEEIPSYPKTESPEPKPEVKKQEKLSNNHQKSTQEKSSGGGDIAKFKEFTNESDFVCRLPETNPSQFITIDSDCEAEVMNENSGCEKEKTMEEKLAIESNEKLINKIVIQNQEDNVSNTSNHEEKKESKSPLEKTKQSKQEAKKEKKESKKKEKDNEGSELRYEGSFYQEVCQKVEKETWECYRKEIKTGKCSKYRKYKHCNEKDEQIISEFQNCLKNSLSFCISETSRKCNLPIQQIFSVLGKELN